VGISSKRGGYLACGGDIQRAVRMSSIIAEAFDLFMKVLLQSKKFVKESEI
jgi:hypothetical protein